MSWTANLDSFAKDKGSVVATVTFTGPSGEKLTDSVRADSLDADELSLWASRKIRSLQRRDASATTLTLGPIPLVNEPEIGPR